MMLAAPFGAGVAKALGIRSLIEPDRTDALAGMVEFGEDAPWWCVTGCAAWDARRYGSIVTGWRMPTRKRECAIPWVIPHPTVGRRRIG